MKLLSLFLNMHVYRLENISQDKNFLSGTSIVCRAVLKDTNNLPRSGDFILVQLSNGRKYKGRIIEFRSFPVEKYVAGDLVIVKA